MNFGWHSCHSGSLLFQIVFLTHTAALAPVLQQFQITINSFSGLPVAAGFRGTLAETVETVS